VSFGVGDATKIDLRDKSVDLVFGSPPYLKARTYGINATRGLIDWVRFMLEATREGLRVSRGLVIWVVAGTTKDGCYTPGPEALMMAAWSCGIELYRPACWYKVDPATNGGCGTPGSGGKQWLRSDWEYVIAFKPQGKLPWADPLFERRPCKYEPGGKARQRQADGSRHPREFENPTFANPGNVIKARVGGGHMGDSELYENEAPFPEKLAGWFVQGWCPPKGWVYDPFCGSGTTPIMAGYYGRHGYGTDLRESQVSLALRRLDRRIKEGRACYEPL
jgi:DNA modification methylase